MRFSVFVLVFLFGFISSTLINFFPFYSNLEFPLENVGFRSNEQKAPNERITEENIIVLEDKIILRIANASISRYSNSGSMIPVLDKGTNGIRIKPTTPDEINKGDIISFRRNNRLIVHRVIEKSFDEKGVYFITAGDNNFYNDGKIRFEDIEYITVGILY